MMSIILKYLHHNENFSVPNTLKSSNFPYTDTFADLMSYVSTENFKNYLIQARKKYSSTPVSGDIEVQERKGKVIVKNSLQKARFFFH